MKIANSKSMAKSGSLEIFGEDQAKSQKRSIKRSKLDTYPCFFQNNPISSICVILLIGRQTDKQSYEFNTFLVEVKIPEIIFVSPA